MRAIGYVRVSTDEQASSGLGLEAQHAAIAAAALRLGLELVSVHADEGVSGSVPPLERPGLASAIDELGDVLLVAKRDRLGRNSLENGLLERALGKRQVRIVSAAGEGTEQDDPASRFLRRILDAVAELERDCAIDRTTKALRAKKARGERAGTIPFGFRLGQDSKLEREQEEQVALLLMQEHRAAGESYASIARTLTTRGYRCRGSKWHPASVHALLKSRRPNGP